MNRVNAHNLRAEIDGVDYKWVGGLGCVIESQERGVRRNDVRMIGGTVFYAHMVDNADWKRRVCWVPQGKIDVEWIRQFKAAIFN